MRRGRIAIASGLVCVILSAGCGRIGNRYVVLVDPAFSHDEQAKVVAALDAWEASVPVQLTARVASCSGIEDATMETIIRKRGIPIMRGAGRSRGSDVVCLAVHDVAA